MDIKTDYPKCKVLVSKKGQTYTRLGSVGAMGNSMKFVAPSDTSYKAGDKFNATVTFTYNPEDMYLITSNSEKWVISL